MIAIVVRARPLSNNIALLVAAGSPYAALVAVTGLALSMMRRRVVMSIVAVVVVAATLAVQVLWYYFGRPPEVGEHVDVRVLSSNLLKGRADASSFVGLARASADVITVSELTPEAVRRFSAAGIGAVFPYSVLVPAPDAAGIGLWSRFPRAEVSPVELDTAIVAVRLRIPGVRFDPVVASVHVTSAVRPYGKPFGDWRTGITSTKAVMDGFADAAGPRSVIVAGDFNSAPDMRQFRDLLTNGYRDAVEQTGAGFAPTSRPTLSFRRS